jgi:small ligand-binding sensory domain FIST
VPSPPRPAAAFASASGGGGDLSGLLADLCVKALGSLGEGGPPDLAVLFASPGFEDGVDGAGPAVRRATGARHLLGCTGIGTLGTEGEHEAGSSASLLLARLPGTRIQPLALDGEVPEALADPEALRGAIGVPGEEAPSFLLLADPYTTDADAWLAALDAAYPGRPVIGGLASGGSHPGVHRLWLDSETRAEGVAGIALCGGSAEIRPLVSQGCRPVGRRFVVTAAAGSRLLKLAGRPAVAALRETLDALPEEDRPLAQRGVHLGRVAHEARPEFRRGDFLIRNILDFNPGDGSLGVGDLPRRGQTVQFQLRDAASATEDLRELLDEAAAEGPASAALLFSCGGRGTHMFGTPHHDITLLRDRLGPVPVAGFFCNGEIGPVGPRSFVHGFTASLALFRPRAAGGVAP